MCDLGINVCSLFDLVPLVFVLGNYPCFGSGERIIAKEEKEDYRLWFGAGLPLTKASSHGCLRAAT